MELSGDTPRFSAMTIERLPSGFCKSSFFVDQVEARERINQLFDALNVNSKLQRKFLLGRR